MASDADRRRRRRPLLLGVLIVLGAAAAASAAGLTWWTQAHTDSLAGPLTTKATGSRTDSLLIPVALVALAGLGAALATTGVLRRGVGALLVLGGGASAVLSAVGLFSAPVVLKTDLTRPALSSSPPEVHAFGPVLGLLGGLLVAAAGVLILLGFGARKGLGARYEVPSKRVKAPVEAGRLDPASDPNVAVSWWKALDAGEDPTGSSAEGADADPTAESRAARPDDLTRSHPPTGPGVSDDVTRGG